MKRKTIEEICKRTGVPVVADDDPRYSEPISITFLSRKSTPSIESVSNSEPSAAAIDLGYDGDDEAEYEDDDEDNQQDPICPICESPDDCPHLLAHFDTTFGEILGGYCFERMDQFRAMIQSEFARLCKAEGREAVSWGDDRIQELWDSALENYSPDDDELIELDSPMQLVIDVFQESGSDAIWTELSDRGPGQSLVYCTFYEADPPTAFQEALLELKKRLEVDKN